MLVKPCPVSVAPMMDGNDRKSKRDVYRVICVFSGGGYSTGTVEIGKVIGPTGCFSSGPTGLPRHSLKRRRVFG